MTDPTPSAMAELKACPCCGAAAELRQVPSGASGSAGLAWRVQCVGCGLRTADGPPSSVFTHIIAAWNARPSDAAAVREACAKVAEDAVAEVYPTDHAGRSMLALSASIAAAIRQGDPVGEGWRTMDSAPKDGRYIVAIVAPNRGRLLQHQAGRAFVIRHAGVVDTYDMGWNLHPGFGGCSDHNFTYWCSLPAAPLTPETPDAA